MNISLYVEVAGCPTVCRHCWAQGTHYAGMPLDDIRWLLERCKKWSEAQGHGFSSWPMHEVVAHAHASAVLKLFEEFGGCGPNDFNLIPTTGVPIALREDWREFLHAFRQTGTKNFWLAFHGWGNQHDRWVSRTGAFEETCLAARRIKEAGFGCGANVFITQDFIKTLPEFMGRAQSLGIDSLCYDIGRYSPLARLKHYEAHRPTLNDMAGVAAAIEKATVYDQGRWKSLERFTESAWRRKALEEGDGAWRSCLERPAHAFLVCRPNLDVHSGMAGLYGARHGNLRADGLETVLQRAMDAGLFLEDQYHFRTTDLPDVVELAQQVGDARSEKVYFEASSIRYLWLVRWAQTRQAVLS